MKTEYNKKVGKKMKIHGHIGYVIDERDNGQVRVECIQPDCTIRTSDWIDFDEM